MDALTTGLASHQMNANAPPGGLVMTALFQCAVKNVYITVIVLTQTHVLVREVGLGMIVLYPVSGSFNFF